jgi:phosphatidylglycerol:prolipoprotein diacylglycerol transferase
MSVAIAAEGPRSLADATTGWGGNVAALVIFAGFLLAAIVVGMHVCRHEARAAGLKEALITDLCFWLLLGAIAGARLLSVIGDPVSFLLDPIEFFRVWNGASFYYGGLVSAVVVGAAFIRRKQLPVWTTADVFALPLAIGHFFVRMGCFFSGFCSGGTAAIQGDYLDVAANGFLSFFPPLHLEALYAACASFLIFGLLLVLRPHRVFSGQLFWIFMALNGVLRLAAGLHADNFAGGAFGFGLTSPRIADGALVVGSVILLIYLWRGSAMGRGRRQDA